MTKAPDAIETARLILRRPRDADANAIFSKWANDPSVTKYLSWPLHESLVATADFIRFSDSEWMTWPAGPFVIESRETGDLIGSTGFGFCSDHDAEVGYVLAGDSWGRGYATEALSALVDLAPGLGLTHLHASIHPDNVASSRVLEKCGFSLEPAGSSEATFPNLPAKHPVGALVYSRGATSGPQP